MNIKICIICLMAVSVSQLCADEVADSSVAREWKFLGAPYVVANSDFGLIFGAGGGISKFPKIYIIYSASVSSAGDYSGGISSAQIVTERWRFENKTQLSKSNRYIYTLNDDKPEAIASTMTNTRELQLSALRRFGLFEIGPTVLIKTVRSNGTKDADDNPSLIDYPRFRKGDIELIGIRSRYQTANIVRPIEGVIFEGMIRAGRMGDENGKGKFEGDTELKLGYAKPVTDESRIYARVWSQFQLNAMPSLQNFLGWEQNHRGQPFMREWGRRVLSGRLQYHMTIAKQTKFPLVYLHELIALFPADRLDWEVVPFYDIGAVGDPANGWNKTRHGLGVGFHIILPPELVFRFDVAFAPGGSIRFFLGAGETL